MSREFQFGSHKLMPLPLTDMAVKKKRVYTRKTLSDKKIMSVSSTNAKKKRVYRKKKDLPHDLIIEILRNLPTRALLNCGAVSKLWYNSIHNDKHFIYSHFLQSQMKVPNFIFNLLNVKDVSNPSMNRFGSHFFRFDTGPDVRPHVLVFKKINLNFFHLAKEELVGYSNGLPCISHEDSHRGHYTIYQPNRAESFRIIRPTICGEPVFTTICHGFGFDSLANEYKLVYIFRTADKQFDSMVFTLGTKSWRSITTTIADLHPIIRIREAKGRHKSAIFCGGIGTSGCLFWKIMTTTRRARAYGNEHEMEMLLSFDLHNEKFQFIQLPPLPTKSSTHEQQHFPHLLEFKGSPCIARIEKSKRNESVNHRRRHHCNTTSCCCCCCCEVHLYVLKDEIKQVWVKEESFNIRVTSTPIVSYMAPDPCCFCVANTTMPSTRICSFSDQIFLYWFNGKCLQFYNLRTKILKVVNSGISFPLERCLFERKLKNWSNMDFSCNVKVRTFFLCKPSYQKE